MSDDLCRLATGGGMRTRALWTDSDEATFIGRAPIMMEGIANFRHRARPHQPQHHPHARAADEPSDRARALCGVRPMQGRAYSGRCATCWRPGSGGAGDASCRPAEDGGFFGLVRSLRARWVRGGICAQSRAATDVILEHDPLARSVEAFMATRKEWRGAAGGAARRDRAGRPITNPRELSDRLRRLAPLLRRTA